MVFDNVPDGYNIVWYDDFTSSELDNKKWCQFTGMSGTANGDHSVTAGEHNLSIKNDELVMSAKREADGTYTSNQSLSTKDRMAFKYGILEMRAKVPYGKPAWPSLWTRSYGPLQKACYMTELDIFEVFAKDDEAASTIHKWYPPECNCHVQKNCGTYRFASKEDAVKYHIYAMNWTPEKIEFSVDGNIYYVCDITEAGEFENTVRAGQNGGMLGMHDYAYLLLNCYIFTKGSSWKPSENSAADGNDEFPIEYRIDWIRLSQKEGEGGIALFPYN